MPGFILGNWGHFSHRQILEDFKNRALNADKTPEEAPQVRTQRSIDIEALDALIQKGEGARVRSELLKVDYLKLPRIQKLAAASFARRSDLSELCVRILNSTIFPSQGKPSDATPSEKAEYGAALIKLGAVTEGMDILSSVDPAKEPRVSLFSGVGYITQWDYAAAIPLLEKAIAGLHMHPFQKLIAQGNLGAAFVHEKRFKEAEHLLEHLCKETEGKFPIVHGNVLKYLAELRIGTEEFEKARTKLGKAQDALASFGARDELYVRKWSAIIDVIESRASKESIRNLDDVQDQALRGKYYETVRDCDFYKAKYTHDLETFVHLYFGTPYPSYRNRMKTEWNGPVDLSDHYAWKLKGNPKTPLKILEGERLTHGDTLKVGQNLHRALSALVSDFYRPFRLATLHSLVFPNDHFNPATSPMKVHTVIKRLRKWCQRSSVPLLVVENAHQYQLSASLACAISVPREDARTNDRTAHTLKLLKEHFIDGFSVAEAATFLGISYNSTWNLLVVAQDEGLLTRTGKARATKYRFHHPNTLKSAA